MKLELPADCRVQIFISSTSADLSPNAIPAPVIPFPPARRHRLLKGGVVLALLGTAYLVGAHTFSRDESFQIARARDLAAGAPPPAAGSSDQLPPSFAQQLRQPPTVTPPPGGAAAVAPAKNPFGLEN